MKIAFASCICTQVFPKQPVWDVIARQQPDHIVLLGDSLYLDIGHSPSLPPQDMEDLQFAEWLYARYAELMAQPRFKALVTALPAGHVHSIWDDHDFLWNDVYGADAFASPVHKGKARLTTAFHEAFRRALARRLAPGSFPADCLDPVFWDMAQPRLSVPSVDLGGGVRLHLTDGRSYRTRTDFLKTAARRHMLGAEQRGVLRQAIDAAPDAVHLLAAGSILGCWKRSYPQDWQWLQEVAAGRRMLALTGDIHRNELDGFFTGGFPLHEATSSGAAVKQAVVAGPMQQNFGLLDIAQDTVDILLFRKEAVQWRRRLDRRTWLPLA